ncbi:MAG: hypothetical protein AAB822_00155, partial [Patescibacteria group bacterium]
DVENINQKLDSHSEMITGLTEDVENINQKLDSHSEMITGLVEDVETIKGDVKFIKGALDKKVDRKDFVVLESRFSLLESKSGR